MSDERRASVEPGPDGRRPPGHPGQAGEPAGAALQRLIVHEIEAAGGWLGFERYMELALYAPGLGYYSRGAQVFGALPGSGSDFITAPELSPLFGRALARQVAQALDATGCDEVWEFGAGSGALAAQLLGALGERVRRYTIVDLSATLAERQRETVQRLVPEHAARLAFATALPAAGLRGVIVGNEVLDAMPVALLHFDGVQWFERGVAWAAAPGASSGPARPGHFVWADRPADLRPPLAGPFVPGTTVELPRQAEGFIRTLAATLQQGAAFFIDYGFPEAEYYHPQRTGGTLMCHRGHRADPDPLDAVGEKDITAHVDFTAIAVAAQDAGLEVLGYTSQGRFLANCGIADELAKAGLREQIDAQKLIVDHEMGEIFKVIGLTKGPYFDALGFAQGDRTHRL